MEGFFLIGSEFCLKSSLKTHLPPHPMPNSPHGSVDAADCLRDNKASDVLMDSTNFTYNKIGACVAA